jgi:murein L,D-transpeptidase YafK
MRFLKIILILLLVAAILGGCARRKRLEAPELVIPEAPVPMEQQALSAEQQLIQDVLSRNGYRNPSAGPTVIVVRKLTRKLVLYQGVTPKKIYPVVLGLNPRADKLFQGDCCTPEGVYRVVTKFDHPRWSKFILLDYPNTQNWLQFGRAKRNGKLPPDAEIGGQVGIHGTHDASQNYMGINWTRGCVSMLNRDVEDLYRHVTEKTLIIIKKD